MPRIAERAGINRECPYGYYGDKGNAQEIPDRQELLR